MFKLEVDVWLACKDRILKQLAQLAADNAIPKQSICLGGSAAMVLMQIHNEVNDIKVWVDSPYFERLAEDHGVLIHPLRDVVVLIPGTELIVRRRNRYFKSVTLENGIDVFDTLSLLIQKRTSYIDPKRPLEEREKDFRDIQVLNEVLAKRNAVVS
jgi:hypothetical protein